MRNQYEQIDYIMKHRRDGMSDKDFREQLENLFQLGYEKGYCCGCEDTYNAL